MNEEMDTAWSLYITETELNFLSLLQFVDLAYIGRMLRRWGLNLSSVISQHSSLVTQLTKRSYARLPSVNDFNDIKKIISHEMTDGRLETILPCPKECDVLIIGGKKNTDSLLNFRLLPVVYVQFYLNVCCPQESSGSDDLCC